MKIVTWNVNSVRARYDRLLNWVEANDPDVLCLQELKTEDAFPFDELAELGYDAAVLGQKTYNGVAIIARDEPEAVVYGFGDGVDDPQSRFLAATVEGVRVVCVYVPNGGELGSDKWHYKLAWYERLRRWLDAHADPAAPLVLCGDFNVAPQPEDVAKPRRWGAGVLCVPEARAALQRVVDWGLVDTFRMHHTGPGHLSWWDYRRRGFQMGDGLRIDMVYATASLAARCEGAFIDVDERRGEKPSDHAPVGATFS